MMCEHEFVQEEWIVEVCKKCDKLRVQTVFEAELAAANARIAELTENQLSPLELAKLYCKLKELEKRAEQAEAQCAVMRCCGNCKEYEHAGDLCSECVGLSQWVGNPISAGTAILAENKRMREALREIGEAKDASATWVQDIAKAALGGK